MFKKKTIIMGLECKSDTGGVISRRWGGAKERVQGLGRIKVDYMYMYEDTIMKPTRYCL
jgi:hypothetical protein